MIPNFSNVDPFVWRGGVPDDDGWNQLKELGVDQVIKLNLDSESTDVAAEALGMHLVYCPIDFDDQILFKPTKEVVQTAVNAIDPNTFVHCEHGQDRTGLVVGCYRLWRQGWSKDKAWLEMLQHGFHPELFGLTLFWESA